MKRKMKISLMDYVRMNRKAAREEEIREHGRPVRMGSVHRSRKVYNRKKDKADRNKELPYFFALLPGRRIAFLNVCTSLFTLCLNAWLFVVCLSGLRRGITGAGRFVPVV